MQNHAGMCLLEVKELNLILDFYFMPKTVEIWPKTGLSFFQLNVLQWGCLRVQYHCHHTPLKFYSE